MNPDDFALRPLTKDDLPAMLRLCRGNPQYFQHMGQPLTLKGLEGDLTALPPGKALQDKHFEGIWQGERLAAMQDWIEGYPREDTAYIGWFILDAEHQGQGVGSALVQRLLERISAMGFARVRLAYAKGNEQSRRFWLKNGFLPTEEEKPNETYTAVLMERSDLSHASENCIMSKKKGPA